MKSISRLRKTAMVLVTITIVLTSFSIIAATPATATVYAGEQARFVSFSEVWNANDYGWGKVSVNTQKASGSAYKFQVTYQWEIWFSHPTPMSRELAGIFYMALGLQGSDGSQVFYKMIYDGVNPPVSSSHTQIKIWLQTNIGWQWVTWEVYYGSYTFGPMIGITGVTFEAYIMWLLYDHTNAGDAIWRHWNYAGAYQGWQSGNYLPVIGQIGSSTGKTAQYFPDIYFKCPGYS
jgi:hypothetical protein